MSPDDLARIARLNFWVNHPDILPFVAPGFAAFDASPFFNEPRNVMLEHAHGLGLFFYAGDGVYEGHYLFGPKLRGREALHTAQRMISEVFTRHGATAILGKVARDHRPARVLTRALGFVPFGRGSVDSFNRPCVDYRLTREQWAKLPWAAMKVSDG